VRSISLGTDVGAKGTALAGKDMSLKNQTIEPEANAVSNNLAEADHRIANHLAMLSRYVRLRTGRLVERDAAPNAEDLRCLTRLIVAQIDAISDLHRILADQGNPDTLDLSIPLSSICKAMQAGVADEINIVMQLEKDCEIALQSILPVTQIFTEVVTNVIKHGCDSEGHGAIKVSCCKSSSETVVVEVSDSGSGLSDTSLATNGDGLGLRLIDTIIRQVDGSIEYLSTSQGLTVRVELPAALQTTLTRTVARSTHSSLSKTSA